MGFEYLIVFRKIIEKQHFKNNIRNKDNFFLFIVHNLYGKPNVLKIGTMTESKKLTVHDSLIESMMS